MVSSPKHESNTKRRPRDSRAVSPLVVFYGMILGRNRYGTENEKRGNESEQDDTESKAANLNSNLNSNLDSNGTEYDDDYFSKDMMERRQEFRNRYENFRGRGRWGGYSLAAIPQEATSDPEPERAPLSVVSTTPNATTNTNTKPTKTATSTTTTTAVVTPPVTKSTKQRRPKRQFQRTQPMLEITDIQQYKDEVVDSTDSSLVVVRFYASWCKACKAIESSYHRLPQDYPSGVKFVEVPLTKENAYMHKGLGIPSLPFAHVYYNGDRIDHDNADNNDNNNSCKDETSSSCRLVEELKINKHKFTEFKRIIRSYVDKECDVHYIKDDDDGTITVASTLPRFKPSIDSAESENEAEAIPVH